jgi:hypothetical protein
MGKRYAAFLLRWWRRDDVMQRIAIEHIQSDARTVVASAPAAVDWLEATLAANSGARRARPTPGSIPYSSKPPTPTAARSTELEAL